MKQLSLVLIGVGHDHAAVIYDTLLRRRDAFSVRAFCVPPEERERFSSRIKKYEDAFGVYCTSVEDALSAEGLHAAIVETEEKNLTQYASLAALRGLHVHMDKPGGFSLLPFETLVRECRKGKLVFSLGYMYRFNPFVKRALQKIKKGELGEILAIHAEMSCEHPKEKRAWLKDLPGGMMFYLGCHLLDLIYTVQGAPSEILPFFKSTEDGVGADFTSCILRYPHGDSFIRVSAREAGGFMNRRVTVYGTKGTLNLSPIEAYDFDNEKDGKDSYSVMQEIPAEGGWCAVGKTERSPLYCRYEDMLLAFRAAATGEEENPQNYDFELALFRLLLRTVGVLPLEG